MPGDRHGPAAGPKGPTPLPEPVLQRIRAALDSVAGEAAAGEAAAQEHAAVDARAAAVAEQAEAGAKQTAAGQTAAGAEQPAASAKQAEVDANQTVAGATKAAGPAKRGSLPRRAKKSDKPEPPVQPAPPPQRVPGAGDGPAPPQVIGKLTLPPSLPRFPMDDASTDAFPAITEAMLGEMAVAARPDVAAPPELAEAIPADPDVVILPPGPPAEQRPDRQDRRDGGPDRPENISAGQEDRQASRAKMRRRAKAPTRPPKPPPPTAPPTAPESSRPLRRPRRRRVVDGLILLVVLVSAGSVAYLLTQHAHTAATANGSGVKPPVAAGTEAAVRGSAAAWVAGQVGPGVKISCDEAMCQALKAHGIPAASLLAMQPKDPDPPRSGIMIVSTAVDGMLGSRLVAADAPVTLANFGSGSMQISIRVIAPQGAAAYSSALRSDIAARKESATGLLQNQRIKMGAEARQQLLAGMVDPRLMLTIASLASQQPVSIVEFSDLAQGASAGVPFRCADLAVTGKGSSPAAQVRSISAFLRGLGSFYSGAHVQVVQFNGRKDVQIEFPAPSPLGLLGA